MPPSPRLYEADEKAQAAAAAEAAESAVPTVQKTTPPKCRGRALLRRRSGALLRRRGRALFLSIGGALLRRREHLLPRQDCINEKRACKLQTLLP